MSRLVAVIVLGVVMFSVAGCQGSGGYSTYDDVPDTPHAHEDKTADQK